MDTGVSRRSLFAASPSFAASVRGAMTTLRRKTASGDNPFGSIPGGAMVLMFGFSYVAIVTSGNKALLPHSAFLIAWLQISNFFITLAAVTSSSVQGGTKWAIGGANTTSAILLQGILKDVTNLETALVIQGLCSLFVALYMAIFIRYGGFFAALNVNIKVKKAMCIYTDFIHPSLIMALSQASAIYMVKYSLELSVGAFEGEDSVFDRSWWERVFSTRALVIWMPSWILGGVSAYLDVRLRKSLSAMTLLLFLPATIFIILFVTVGGASLSNIPDNLYWQIGSFTAKESIQSLNFSELDGRFVLRRLPFIIFGGLFLAIEALLVYKQYAMIPRGKENHGNAMLDGRNLLWSSAIIGCLGGWFGHQSFVESLVNFNCGFRGSIPGAIMELSMFVVFGIAFFLMESLPAFPTIMLSSTVFYLAIVFFDIMLVQRRIPIMTIFEWAINIVIIIFVFVFGYNTGMILGTILTTLILFSDKFYNGYIVDRIEYDEQTRTLSLVMLGHLCHGSLPTVFEHLVKSIHYQVIDEDAEDIRDSFLSSRAKKLIIDMTGVESADSSITQLFNSLSLLLQNEFGLRTLTIIHQFDKGSVASQQLIEVKTQNTSLRESQRGFEPQFRIIDVSEDVRDDEEVPNPTETVNNDPNVGGSCDGTGQSAKLLDSNNVEETDQVGSSGNDESTNKKVAFHDEEKLSKESVDTETYQHNLEHVWASKDRQGIQRRDFRSKFTRRHSLIAS